MKTISAAPAACSGACLACRGSLLPLFFHPRIRLCCTGATAACLAILPQVHNCLDPSGGFWLQGQVFEAFFGSGRPPQSLNILRERETGHPGKYPREGGALPTPGQGNRVAPSPGTLQAKLMKVVGGHPRVADRKRPGEHQSRDHCTETALGAGSQPYPGMEGAGEEK